MSTKIGKGGSAAAEAAAASVGTSAGISASASAGPSAAASAEAVFEAVHTVMHLYRAQHARGAGDGAAGAALTHMEHKVLGFFSRRPGATQSDLAVHSGRDKGQLARLIAGLKQRGLLEARADEHDRRNLRLHPTAAARAVHQAAQRHARRVAATAVVGLSADERAQLLALLGRVQAQLESSAGSGAGHNP